MEILNPYCLWMIGFIYLTQCPVPVSLHCENLDFIELTQCPVPS